MQKGKRNGLAPSSGLVGVPPGGTHHLVGGPVVTHRLHVVPAAIGDGYVHVIYPAIGMAEVDDRRQLVYQVAVLGSNDRE